MKHSTYSTDELRKRFITYFESKNHTLVPGSSLIPGNDPTLLFTNAGMVQFKDVFLGHEQRPYKRAVSSQGCVRAGGKHNDLDNVGYTARHHTFFEMLGNFSFGDYFKKQAIEFAWEFLTQELKLPPEKLWITVHITDKEAEDIWINEIKIDPKRLSRCDEDNFWSMGDVGPCGPCTEIFYDHGDHIEGGPPGSADGDGDRYVEIWNLVFMQFNRAADGKMTSLPKPSVDTGMGLERLAAVMQDVNSNYDIDIFKELIAEVANIAKTTDLNQPSLRVIADHIRSTSFLIADGVRPSNEGRGYVLRRIIRRAVRHGYKLGIQQAFLHKLVKPLFHIMGDFFVRQAKETKNIEQVLLQEEQQFSKTLAQGMKIFQQATANQTNKEIAGDVIFKLYDTYGFPVDLSADMAREHGFTIDIKGFEKCMEQQRAQSQAHSSFVMAERMPLDDLSATEFTGYTQGTDKGNIIRILKADENTFKLVETLAEGDTGIIILDKTPFYPEGGGQVGDTGYLIDGKNRFVVKDTTKQDGIILHHGEIEKGEFAVGKILTAEINIKAREATRLNHSATHLLHAALRKVLGTHVVQKGSLVNPNYLRFDFAHFSPVTPQQIREIEWIVNEQIWKNSPVCAEVLDKEQATERGALALFEEKYGDKVRVLTIGNTATENKQDAFSIELCGGTHVSHTGDIGLVKITQETGIAAGVRRIEAITGPTAFEYIAEQDKNMSEMAGLLKTSKDQVPVKLQQLLDRNRELEKEIERWQSKNIRYAIEELIPKAKKVGDIMVLSATFNEAGRKGLKEATEMLLSKWDKAVVCLAAVEENQVAVVAAVSKSLASTCPANQLVQSIAEQIDGKGGGKPDFAQGGGQPEKLPSALASVENWVKDRVK